MKTSNMKLVIAIMSVTTACYAAEQVVNQGTPGTRGAWPVTSTGSSGTSTSSRVNAIIPSAVTTSLNANATPCTAAGGASCTIIYPLNAWTQWPNITITVRNSGANTIENVLVEWSPDGTNFEVWDSTTFANLTAGTIKSIAISGNSRRYLRIEARASANTSAVVSITANDG